MNIFKKTYLSVALPVHMLSPPIFHYWNVHTSIATIVFHDCSLLVMMAAICDVVVVNLPCFELAHSEEATQDHRH